MDTNGLPTTGELSRRLDKQDVLLLKLQDDVSSVKSSVAVIVSKLEESEKGRAARLTWWTAVILAVACLISAVVGALVAVLVH
jgi:hypothetical protein